MRVQGKRERKGIFKRLKERIAKIGTLNIVLICVGLFFVWFNCQMLEMFKLVGSIPETYACAVIAATIGECGICGWIRTNKDKKQSRDWEKEDQKSTKEIHDDGQNTGL